MGFETGGMRRQDSRAARGHWGHPGAEHQQLHGRCQPLGSRRLATRPTHNSQAEHLWRPDRGTNCQMSNLLSSRRPSAFLPDCTPVFELRSFLLLHDSVLTLRQICIDTLSNKISPDFRAGKLMHKQEMAMWIAVYLCRLWLSMGVGTLASFRLGSVGQYDSRSVVTCA